MKYDRKMFHFRPSPRSSKTLRCLNGFSLEHRPLCVSDYWLSLQPNPGLALG